MLNELVRFRQLFNRHLFHAGRQSVMLPTLSFGWSRLTAPGGGGGYRHIIHPTVYIGRQYGIDIGCTSAGA